MSVTCDRSKVSKYVTPAPLLISNFPSSCSTRVRTSSNPRLPSLLGIEALGQADPVVRNGDRDPLSVHAQPDADHACAFIREGVFEGIADQFIQDEATGYGLIQNKLGAMQVAFQ